ncbi:tRNA pseudouridine38-40 synthase [Gracilibacillus ureilyticus]|uniref:tRNA pseudouridine synthase A n=1 Tax=Gracilibacillus ureilyticus TaxID=531814 RepID=A0A1H9VGG8_9BACI|nr:tRNA pseudouridine(38-40) synthase TruA [Gracilibacillus ureilyticus]SES20564.1 tRNA pseudouridine38-40 synthase [Gracilibacillus ureilyticus]
MLRIKAIISYDGTNFSGYQIQPNGRTVQASIESVLQKMHKGEHIRVTASGRTDQGVHAVGQTIHFDTNLQIPLEGWRRALNTMLPEDIEVRAVENVSDEFHARFDVEEKEYRYVVWNDTERNIFKRHYQHHVSERLSIEKMKKACELLTGKHDFTSFCAANSNVKGDKIRTIHHASVESNGAELIFKVRGNGFLYNMVRIIVGTLIEIGKGKREPEEMQQIIEARDRSVAGHTAPAQGLYLWKVYYHRSKDL